jgi:undecaprenyl-diphosphatase
MDLWIAVILGIVEGITEFLPVSSTGHLILAGSLVNFTGEKAACFEVFIQLGAILAVVVLYYQRFLHLVPVSTDWLHEKGFAGLRGVSLLLMTSFPALIAGALAHKTIKTYLFTPLTVMLALGVGGIAIILAEKFKPEASSDSLDDLTYKQALFIGVFQCFSLWPGMSRAASTIIGGLFSGLDRRLAAEYSFLAAVPIMIAATLYDLYKTWHLLSAADFSFFAVGFVVSFVSAILAVKAFIGMLQRWTLVPFAVYRIVIAPVAFIFWPNNG